MAQLDGVLTSVKTLSEWAAGQGYDVVSIDDRVKRVTVDRIKDELAPIDPTTEERDAKRLLDRPRIVVYFCGHGLHAPQDQYWILSAGPSQPNDRISAVGFREMLATYGPKQIAIISDACRSAQVVQGLASSVVDAYQGATGAIQKDNFFSSQDGQASFAVPSKGGKPAYCIFSSVLMRALSPPVDPDALDELYLETGRMIVSSQSLATYLERNVPNAALDVGKLQDPQCEPGFRPVKNRYVDFGPCARPMARAMTKEEAIIAERSEAQNERINRSRSEWRRPYVDELQRLMGEVLWESINRHQRGPLLLSSNSDALQVEVPELVEFDTANYVIDNFQHRRRSNLWTVVAKPFADSGRSGVAIAGAEDLYAAIPLHHRLWCAAVIDKGLGPEGSAGGLELLAWGDHYQPPPTELSAAEALKGLSARTLNAEDTAILAQDMRYLKHADPMYGIVAAYLYNAIGDVANIRRMCYYYKYHQQDVPFDIAMLAQLELKARGDGGFYVEVPKVAQLPEARRPPNAPDFVWERTPAATVNVAGVSPLLRTGWQHIQTSRHPVHQKCWELTAHLTESPISTFQGRAIGARLIKIMREL